MADLVPLAPYRSNNAPLVKRPWTPEEDELLIAAVNKFGASRWSMIATAIATGRVGKQCRERWNNHLCPEVKKGTWTTDEDHAIMRGVAVLGSRWCEIVKDPLLAGRTDNSIKNRFYSLERNMKAKQPSAFRVGPVLGPLPVKNKDKDEKPLPQKERVMALALELAFTTDEHDRDNLIEQLTAASAPSEEEKAESAAADAALESVLSVGLDADTVTDDLAEYLRPASNDALAVPEPLAHPLADTFTDLADYLGLPQEAKASSPLRPRTAAGDAKSPRFVVPSGRISATSNGSSDAESDASTIRIEETTNNATGTATGTSHSTGEEASPTQPVSARKRRPTCEARSEDKWGVEESPSPAKLTDTPPSTGTEEPDVGGTMSLGGGMGVTAACLGGRHAHKALLAPLSIPLDDAATTDSPKRMRTTPNGGSAVPWHMRRPAVNPTAALGDSPTGAPLRSAGRGLIRPSPLRATTGTKEPGTVRDEFAASPSSTATTGTNGPASPFAAVTVTKEHGIADADLASPTTAVTGTKEPGMARGVAASPDFTWLCGAELFTLSEFDDLFHSTSHPHHHTSIDIDLF